MWFYAISLRSNITVLYFLWPVYSKKYDMHVCMVQFYKHRCWWAPLVWQQVLRTLLSLLFKTLFDCLLVACLKSQQHASVSQGRICSDNFTCCHTEIEVAYQTFYLTQSQYTDTSPTSPSADPITPGAWQGSHWSANFWVTGMTRPPHPPPKKKKNPCASGIRTRDLPLSRWTPYH